jgi:SWI/SNF-related matrix-associated actin-dependent regulator 1 of chromatin subfamily A
VRLFLDHDLLALDFPYDQDQVAEIKQISGAKWDKVSKLWKVPLGSIGEVREFALKHEFEVSEEVLLFTPPKRQAKRGAYLKGDWIFIQIPYDKVIINGVKKIPGITWDKGEVAWRAPVTSAEDTIYWAESFSVPVDATVFQVADEMKSKLEELQQASRSVDAEIEVPLLQGSLLPYQKAGVAYATRAKRSFIADEMGLGKTIQAIATLEYSSEKDDVYPAVIVCPPTLALNWKAEWNRWLPHRRVSVVSNRKDFPEPRTYDVVVVGYSNIQHWEKQLTGHNSYVFDESHYAKTPTAQRTKSAIKMAKSAPKHGIVLCLTGTPVTNRPAEYASQLDIIGKLKEFGGLWGFYRRYCNAFQDRFGQWNISGHSHLDELNDRLRGTCYIRRTKSQVLSELPPVVHSPVLIEGTESGLKEYAKAERDIIKYITDRAREIALELGESPYSAAVVARIKAESNEHLVKLSVLRRLAAKAKMPVVEEWVKERIADGKKVVIAAHHRDIVDELAKKFGNLRIQGDMKVTDIEEQKHKFQTLPVEEAPVIVLSIQAAKTGHTLTAAQDIVFVELPWTPADLDQTYSRLHRIGQKGSVTATYLLTEGTIDEEIYSLIEKKRGVVNAAVEGGEFAGSSASQLVMKFLDRH